MEKDTFAKKWKLIKDDVRWWWFKLTEDDVALANGNLEVFVGLLQEKYGYTRERALAEIERHIRDNERDEKQNRSGSNG